MLQSKDLNTISLQNSSDSEISEKIINSLPGIFYLYEKIGDQVFLKRWNINHVKVFGYSDEELINSLGSTFFTKKEYKRVEKVIEKVFTEGTSQIQTRLLTKSGKQVHYLLEAFSFVENDGHYMMGVGIDITSRVNLERNLLEALIEKNKLELEKVKVNKQLASKKRELIALAIESGKRNRIISTTLIDLNSIIKGHPQNELIQRLINIRTNIEQQFKIKQDWELFKLNFIEVHHDFLNNLHKKHPTLTSSELRLCAYLRIHLSSYQISDILNVTPGAIKKTRYRIRKKIGLATKDSLDDYILSF